MNIIKYIDNNTIKILSKKNENIFDIDSCIDNNFIEEINQISDNSKYQSDYINEIFFHYEFNGYKFEKYFHKFNINEAKIHKNDKMGNIFISKCLKNKISISLSTRLKYFILSIINFCIATTSVLILSLLLPLYTILKYGFRDKDNISNFSIIRSKASNEKMSFIKEDFDVLMYEDSLTYKNNYLSMYNMTITEKLLLLIIIPYYSIRDFIFIIKESNMYFDSFFSGYILNHYKFRIVHKNIYEYALKLLLKHSNGIYYTGNKEDRFAICEKRLLKKYDVKSICIPHGLEYSFKRPAGLVGDNFYCTSENAKKVLTNLYSENNFIFDKQILSKMFSKNLKKVEEQKIVFFTESRGIEINKKIIESLLKNGINLYLKLHPKDNVSNYNIFKDKITILNNLNEAITNNICISRKSTILVESFFNGSFPIAILLEFTDKVAVEHLFPSLSDNSITKVYDVKELKQIIKVNKYNAPTNS